MSSKMVSAIRQSRLRKLIHRPPRTSACVIHRAMALQSQRSADQRHRNEQGASQRRGEEDGAQRCVKRSIGGQKSDIEPRRGTGSTRRSGKKAPGMKSVNMQKLSERRRLENPTGKPENERAVLHPVLQNPVRQSRQETWNGAKEIDGAHIKTMPAPPPEKVPAAQLLQEPLIVMRSQPFQSGQNAK